MFESFLIVLREGIEAALIIGIILVMLRNTNRHDLIPPVYWGIAMSVVASIVMAIALENLPINEEAYEGAMYWVSGIFVASMMWWMHQKAKTLKKDIESRVRKTIDAAGDSGNLREAIGLGAFAFLMVFREGAETVMFLSAINLKSNPIGFAIGSIAGFSLALAFCVLFIKGSININLGRFFRITEWILGILVFQLFVSGYYELVESGVFREIDSVMLFIKPLHKASSIVTILAMAVAVFGWYWGEHSDKPDKESLSRDEYTAAIQEFKIRNTVRIGAMASTAVIILALSIYFINYKLPEITGMG
ncbi:MAG TPA: FTR1 family protein [bacterium]|jgi:FTR1 family protein